MCSKQVFSLLKSIEQIQPAFYRLSFRALPYGEMRYFDLYLGEQYLIKRKNSLDLYDFGNLFDQKIRVDGTVSFYSKKTIRFI